MTELLQTRIEGTVRDQLHQSAVVFSKDENQPEETGGLADFADMLVMAAKVRGKDKLRRWLRKY